MSTIWSENDKPFTIEGVITVGVYPSGEADVPNLKRLGLIREDKLAVIATGDESLEGVDAAVTSLRDITLGIRTKDCAPICFGDGKKIAIAHIGWQGFSMGLLEKTFSYFDPATVKIYVGPFLNAFEIKKDFCYDALMAKPGAAEFIKEEDDKLIFYFKDAIASILPEEAVFDVRTTATDTSLPSWRRGDQRIGFLTTVAFR